MNTASKAPQIFHDGFCAPASRKYILITAILASAMGFIDGSVVSLAIPAMRETLGASLVQAQWISNAYMLILSAFILVGGAFGDRFGPGRIFGLGIAVFVAASLLCALAPSPSFLIWARMLQGLGAALMVPGSLAIISRAYPREERGRAIGTWAASAAITTAFGPVLGGLALTFLGPEMWRSIFAINLPLGLIALWLLRTHVKLDHGQPDKGVDLIGATFAVIGLGAVAYGLTLIKAGGANSIWPIGLGLVTLLTFVWWEARAPHPMLPLSLFSLPGFSAVNLATLLRVEKIAVRWGLYAILFESIRIQIGPLFVGLWAISAHIWPESPESGGVVSVQSE